MVPSVISAVSALIALLVHRQVKTPSGVALGRVVESAHDTGIANNLLLRQASPETKIATVDELHSAAAEGPSIPADNGEHAA